MTPIPPANSPTEVGAAAPVLQNAQVSPYLGSTSTNFTWSVQVYPGQVPKGNSTLNVTLDLYVSTCPGATGNDSPSCAAGYPLTVYQLFHGDLPNQTVLDLSFSHTIPSNGIWAWQMGLFLHNSTVPNENQTFILLAGDPVYNGLEGPVVGTYWTTYELLILTVYLNDFVYLGVPYYVVLLVYTYIKRRQISRGDAFRRAPGPTPTDSPDGGTAVPGTGPTPGAKRPASLVTSGPRRPEMSCPNCNAVVYENEKTCWKCGAALPAGGSSPPLAQSPLPSNPPKPP
jgi:hypothetical protein